MKQTIPNTDHKEVEYLFGKIFQYKTPLKDLERPQPPNLDIDKAELEIDLHYAQLAIAALNAELINRDIQLRQCQTERDHYRTALEDTEYELQLILETTPSTIEDNSMARTCYTELRCLLQKPLLIIQKRLP